LLPPGCGLQPLVGAFVAEQLSTCAIVTYSLPIVGDHDRTRRFPDRSPITAITSMPVPLVIEITVFVVEGSLPVIH